MRAKMHSRFRTIMLCVATLLSSLVFVVLGPASPAQADPDCMTNGGVYVVFVRGSGEHFSDQRANQFYWNLIGSKDHPGRLYGKVPTAWAEIGNLDGRASSDNNADDPAEYPAVGWADWGIPTGMDGYYRSVWTGVSELATHLNDRARRCPQESIVVGGYSQGAEVMGYALQSVSDYTLSHIGYAAFYGDPRSSACDRITRVPWSRGNANCALGSLGARMPYIPNSMIGRVGSWCDSRDGVCTGNTTYLPLPGNPLSTHGSAYDGHWIADSANEIVNKALAKRNELNPSSAALPLPSYTITPPDLSPDSPAAPPAPPVIQQLKRTLGPDGAHQVYATTKSTVTEAWWKPGGDGVHPKEIINISQDNIVGFDKVNEPGGVTQSLYTAVSDGVWETYWKSDGVLHSNKIVSGLSGVRQVIAAGRQESAGYTHRLYVLAIDGPHEYWWRDGGDGIHHRLLDSIAGPVTMDKATGPDGADQLYVATPTWVYELWWRSDTGVNHGTIINITQGDIRSIDKTENQPDGGQALLTGTSTTAWQTY
jgi:hypothetical protein